MALLDTYKSDNLIATNVHPLSAQTVTVASGEGQLKRGTVLSRNSSDKFQICGTSSTTPEVILAADVDATSADAVAEVYNSGDFNGNELIVKNAYTLTSGDIADLKKAGIYIMLSVDQLVASSLGV